MITSFTIQWGASELTFTHIQIGTAKLFAAIDAAGNCWITEDMKWAPKPFEVTPEMYQQWPELSASKIREALNA